MRVKTFVSGIANGWSETFRYLDEQVAGLGDIKIVSVTDQVVSNPIYDSTRMPLAPLQDAHVVRLIVYE